LGTDPDRLTLVWSSATGLVERRSCFALKPRWSFLIVTAGLALGGLFYFSPCIELSTERDGVLCVYPVGEGDAVVLSHVNSIYDAPVEEILRVKGGSFELEDVRTPSYGVKEYYGIAEGITRRRWTEFTFHNSSGRSFSLKIGGRPVREVETHRDQPITVRLGRFYPIRLLFMRFY
jgi:hypothetical protein